MREVNIIEGLIDIVLTFEHQYTNLSKKHCLPLAQEKTEDVNCCVIVNIPLQFY